MDLSKQPVNSYPKAKQLHQREKPTPKIKEQRYKKKRTYKGRTIPTKKQRSAISKKEYKRAIEAFGEHCAICGNHQIEMHHLRYRSQGGKGGFRNLIPLCSTHHRQAHSSREFAEQLRFERRLLFGDWYWADKYDLFQNNLIPNTTNEAFEKFMEREMERVQENVGKGENGQNGGRG